MSSAPSPQMRHVHEALSAAGSGTPREQGGQWRAKCPAHDDHQASLMVAEGHKKVIFNCHAGCSYEAIVEALDLDPLSVYADQPTSLDDADRWMPDDKQAIAVYRYTDEQGKLLFGVSRSADKDFRQWRPDPSKKYGRTWSGVGGVRKVPYHLPALLAGIGSGRRVYVVEGEKDVHALEAKGEVATCNAGGAGKWPAAFAEFLDDAEVIVVADRDTAGDAHAQQVVASLAGKAKSVAVVQAVEGKDAADHLAAGFDPDGFTPHPAFSSSDSLIRTRSQPKRMAPRLGEEAYHGLAGRIVWALDPFTEADPAGVLVTLLTAAGNMVGRRAHFHAGDEQPGRLFSVLVAPTGLGRKGTCWSTIKPILALADSDWYSTRCKTGLSSGEGLIAEVADDDDDPLQDKRLFVKEAEFAKVLEVITRQGNSLSHNVRDAYDGEPLGTMTRGDPLRATDHHVSILGMITPDELQRKLTEGEQASGFANRFLFVNVKMSKVLPLPKRPDPKTIEYLGDQLGAAVNHASGVYAMRFDAAAEKVWVDFYVDSHKETDDAAETLRDTITSRGPTHTLRLAVVYALLDRSDVVREEHLRAALAVWRYCEATAAMHLGDATGDKMADRLLDVLRKAGTDGMTRKDLFAATGNHAKAPELDRAMGRLETRWRLVVTEEIKDGKRGRNPQMAWAVEHAPDHLRPTEPTPPPRTRESDEHNQGAFEPAVQRPEPAPVTTLPTATVSEQNQQRPAAGSMWVKIACLGDCLTTRTGHRTDAGQPCKKCGGPTALYDEGATG